MIDQFARQERLQLSHLLARAQRTAIRRLRSGKEHVFYATCVALDPFRLGACNCHTAGQLFHCVGVGSPIRQVVLVSDHLYAQLRNSISTA